MATETTERSFDELASGLARGTLSRGKALRLLGGVLLGSALASVPGAALADDDCRGFGRRCRRDRQCCSRNCVRRGDDKVCGCPEGKTRCRGRCVTNCTGGQTLDPETCECGCPSGQVLCNGACVSTSCPTGQIFDPSSCACVAQCLPHGSPHCTADTQCCGGICNTAGTSVFCDVCRYPGGSCTNGETCCFNGTCRADGTCCGPVGATCRVNSDCCGGNCSNGGSGIGTCAL